MMEFIAAEMNGYSATKRLVDGMANERIAELTAQVEELKHALDEIISSNHQIVSRSKALEIVFAGTNDEVVAVDVSNSWIYDLKNCTVADLKDDDLIFIVKKDCDEK